MRVLGGYAGSILRVNLSNGKIVKVPVNKLVADYLGGTGFCVKILYDETGPETDPLGPENRLVIATGPVTGTYWPGSARLNIAAMSPLGHWGEANSGGTFAKELKFAGYDAIVVHGRAEKPVYVWIDDDEVEVRDAGHLWGKSVWETDDIVKKDVGDENIEVASIGPGGENLVMFAGIFNARFRAAARSGMGTVMASKRLKAVAVRGSKGIKVADPGAFSKLFEERYQKWREDPYSKIKTKYGTMYLVEAMNEIGRFPTRNHQSGVFPMANKLYGDVFLERFLVRDVSCAFCCKACKSFFAIRSGPHAGLCGHSPEYETINSFGSSVWNDDPELVLRCNWLCNQYGLDTISTGAAIAFAMELWEKGVIDLKDTGGIDFSWGNKETIVEMVHKIAKREGFGDVLANGVRKAAERIGREAKKYAMHVKGLEISAQDGRAQKSMGIAHAASARGADHLRHSTFFDEVVNEDAVKRRWGDSYLPEIADRLATRYKGIMAKDTEDMTALIDSMGLCIGGVMTFWFDDIAKLYTAVVGIKVDSVGIQRMAERIVEQRRAFNVRLGLTRKDDTLPERFLKEMAPAGPCKGHVVDLKPMLDEYYQRRGYDLETGLIPRARLEKLGLKYVADELEKLGKLSKEKIKGE